MILFSLTIFITLTAQAQSGKNLAQTFVPGTISSDSIEFNAVFSPDGRSFYFTRSVNKRTQLYYSVHVAAEEWSKPVALPFSDTNYSDADPAFSPGGELYFISNRPTHPGDTIKDYDIWKVTRTSTKQWSQPVNVKELNSPENEYYISFTAKGNAYFSSSRKGGYGEEDIYFSKYANNKFEVPENIGGSINTSRSEYDPFITANGFALIFTSSGRDDSFGKADLYWSVRTTNGWQNVSHFNETINTSTRDYCPSISQDKKYFFYSSSGDIKYVAIDNLPAELVKGIRSK